MEFITFFHDHRLQWRSGSSAILSIIWVLNEKSGMKKESLFSLLPRQVYSVLFSLVEAASSVHIDGDHSQIFLLPRYRRYLHYTIYPLAFSVLPGVLINDFTVNAVHRLLSFLGETWNESHFSGCGTCLSETFLTSCLFLEETAKNVSHRDSIAYPSSAFMIY